MTILHDEHKPTQPTPSDAVVELIKEAAANANPEAPFVTFSSRRTAEAILSALSDAGLAVRADVWTAPMIEAFYREMDRGALTDDWTPVVERAQQAANAAFHPSQLEKTDE